MEALLISACLLGERCRYDGQGKPVPEIDRLRARYRLVPVCPEQLGGLPTPRAPAEVQGIRVRNRDGADVTAAFQAGAEAALQLAGQNGCRRALLKARSPSCGAGEIYDGSFTGARRPGDGLCARLLKQNGIAVFNESQIEEAFLQTEEE